MIVNVNSKKGISLRGAFFIREWLSNVTLSSTFYKKLKIILFTLLTFKIIRIIFKLLEKLKIILTRNLKEDHR